MMKPEEFIGFLQQGQGRDSSVFRLGAIPTGYVSGRPQVQFDGESTTSTRTYPYLSSYTPAAGERVLVAMVGHGGVILGKVV
ncbi:hypothetical protein JCM15765_14640 [Paradesulfitobacterium aromaticivorans]